MDNNYEPIGLSKFFGGWSTDKQLGTKSQFYYSRHLDFRKNPSSISILPGTSKADGGIVVDLVQSMEQINSGVRYALGDAGWLYKVSTAGVWSTVVNIGESGGAGLVYRADVDHLYATGQTKVSRIPRVSSGSSPQKDWFKSGISTSSTCFQSGSSKSYTVPTSTSEAVNNKRSFTTDIEPIEKIGVNVIAKGTGDWTLTLHDDANNVLGAATVTTANLTSGRVNYFTFSSPIRVQRGNNGAGSALTYHFHLTSTVADGTISTSATGLMSNCDMELWASALVPTSNGLHPMINFSNFTLIGNGRYVAAYEPLQDNPTTSDFTRHRLTLPPGFEVCGFAQKNLMCVIGAEKRSTSGEFQEGMLFFWDGSADTYNDFYPVPEGSPESLFSHKNVVYFIAGGALYRMRGGDEPIKKKTFRNTDSEFSGISDTTHLYPNMMTVRRGILLIGFPSTTTNRSIEHAIYSYGAVTSEYPESFGYSYSTSNGNILNTGTNNLKLGVVKSYGDTLYVSWRDDSSAPHTYGVDIVNNSSSPATTAQFETLQFDNEQPGKYKKAGYLLATFVPLPSTSTFTLKYKLDDDANWTYSESATTGATYCIMPIDKRYLLAKFGFDITCSSSTTVEVSSIYMYTDILRRERPIGG